MNTKHRGLLDSLEQAARHRYQALFEASRDGALVVDTETATIVDANHAMGLLTGLSARELVGRPYESLFSKDRVDAVRSLLISKRDDPPRVLNLECAGGDTRHVEATSTRVQLEGRNCVYVVLRDVTEREKLEAERERLLLALHEAHKLDALGHLAGGIAHDMNNVLSVVLSCARAVRSGITGVEEKEDVEQILTAASRGRDLVMQLLAFARKEPERREAFDIFDALREATTLCARLLPPRITLRVEVPDAQELLIGDRSQIVQAIMNLCVNARDAMHDQGLLNVWASVEDKRVVIRLQDTGSGMAEEVQRRAFEPFFTTKPRGAGTGLGLSMVYTAVRAHRGDVRIESELGRGTRFTFWLPRGSADEPEVHGPVEKPKPRHWGRALVIDDDENVGRVLGNSLRSMGFDVDIAHSGDEGVSKMKNGPAPCVAVCDLVMPGLDGTETMRQLRLLDPSLPVIIASGFLESAEGERIRREGASAVLSKPFSMADLRQVVTAVLET